MRRLGEEEGVSWRAFIRIGVGIGGGVYWTYGCLDRSSALWLIL